MTLSLHTSLIKKLYPLLDLKVIWSNGRLMTSLYSKPIECVNILQKLILLVATFTVTGETFKINYCFDCNDMSSLFYDLQ